MRNTLLPLLGCLALCGGATAAVLATNAQADQPHRPQMIAALNGDEVLAQNVPQTPPQGARPDGRQNGREGRRAGTPPTPAQEAARHAQMCTDEYARAVGETAFLEARLTLTPAQQSTFAHWKDASLAIAKRHSMDCTARKMPARDRQTMPPAPTERMAREEERLKKRLADVEQERPALEALWTVLTPEQRMAFGHRGGPMGGIGRGGMRMAMMGRGGMGPDGMGHGMMGHRGEMGHGEMGQSEMGHGMGRPFGGPKGDMPPPDAPDAPPPQ